jgi:hypothetical protein
MNYLGFFKKSNAIPTKNNPVKAMDYSFFLKFFLIQRHKNEVNESERERVQNPWMNCKLAVSDFTTA